MLETVLSSAQIVLNIVIIVLLIKMIRQKDEEE